MENKTRSFVCLDFPDEIMKEAARIQELVSKKKFSGKLTELENLHITLKFLGELTQSELEKVKERLKKVKFPELTPKLEKVGVFNFRGSPKIVWIKIVGGIFELQKEIDLALSDLFPEEQRFMSHLTIARIKKVLNVKEFTSYIQKIKPKNLEFACSSFKLKKSELRLAGPIYTTIQEFNLIKKELWK